MSTHMLHDTEIAVASFLGVPLAYDWQFIANQFILAPSLLRLMIRVYFQQNPYRKHHSQQYLYCCVRICCSSNCLFSPYHAIDNVIIQYMC
jgi:hypothetical protein